MTATRIGAATLTALWLAAALVLWRTQVPADLELPRLDASAYVAPEALALRERHDRFLRLAGLAALAAQLVVLVLLVRTAPRPRGRRVARGAQLGALVAVAVVAVALPFELAGLWWQRRYDVALLGYGTWTLEQVRALLVAAAVGAAVGAAAVALAGALRRRWWVAGTAALAAAGVVYVLAQPLLTPRVEPLRDAELEARVARLAARQHLPPPRVEVRKQAARVVIYNAEALGVGPTTRVILWDTALRLRPRELDVLVAHELAHVSRDHLWKGLAWFCLLALPGVYLVARLTRLEIPEQLPRAALVAALFAVAATPFANAISRRYEAEADWVALETTRRPDAAARLFGRLAEAGLRDPQPPLWSRQLFGTHPSMLERISMARAWSRRTRAGEAPRAGS